MRLVVVEHDHRVPGLTSEFLDDILKEGVEASGVGLVGHMELHERPLLADRPYHSTRPPSISLQPHVDRLVPRHPNPRALLPHHG